MMVFELEALDFATEVLGRIEAAAQSPELFRVLGRTGANLLRAHFRDRNLNGPRNQFGAPSSNFWDDVRSAVNDEEVGNGQVTIKIAHPAINQKVYGGTIKADDKLLAIPARTEAYGHSPRDFSNLEAVFFKSGAIGLAAFTPGEKRKKGELPRLGGPGGIYFWLVESVTQDPDPEALPEREEMEDALLTAADEFFNSLN